MPARTAPRPTPKLGCELLEGRVAPSASVSVTALTDADEGGGAGLFRFTRSEAAGPLTVHFSVTGTAAPLHDYTPFGTTVTFGSGDPYAYATVAAVADVIGEPTESVTVTLQQWYNYAIGSPGAATVFIHNIQPPPATFDLDVNANGALGDPVDGAANYLPGYEGTTPKVSIGTNFNAPAYQGQHLKLVLDGIGRDTANLVQVEFELIGAKTTSYPGYASNRTHDTIQGANKAHDYSFHPYRDYLKQPAAPGPDDPITTITRATPASPVGGVLGDRPVSGEVGGTRTWISLYCKDYGGATQARVRAHYNLGGMQQVREFPLLNIPVDADNNRAGDGLADKWELEMGARWNAQYGVTLTAAQRLAGFAPGMDAEVADPDHVGPGRDRLVDQAETGDAHTILEEYRGYVLDGGGLDGAGQNGHTGGHIRLDPARKEILVEVDRAAVVNNIPAGGLGAVMEGASGVFSNARGAGIYMYYLFDELTLNLPKADVDEPAERRAAWKASRDTVAARAPGGTPNLKTDFFHFLFVDENGMTGGTGGVSNDTAADRHERGSMIAVSDMKTAAGTAGLNPAKFDEFLMTTAAHEITHLLFGSTGRSTTKSTR